MSKRLVEQPVQTGERKRSDPPGYIKDGQLTCRVCGCHHFDVVNTYAWGETGKERRRQCRHCGWIVRTREIPIGE